MPIDHGITQKDIDQEFIADCVKSQERYQYEVLRRRSNERNMTLPRFINNRYVLDLIDSLGDEKASAVVQSVRGIHHQSVTKGQWTSLCNFLLSKYGNERTAFAAAFGVTEEAMFGNVLDKSLQTSVESINAKLRARAMKALEHEKSNEAAAEIAAFAGWPTLTGSKDQVGWAESIRYACLNDPYASESDINRINTSRKTHRAAWWIDARPRSVEDALSLLFK